VWKKSDETPQPSTPAPPPPAPSRNTSSGQRATIGPSIVVKGDLSGDEDLVIHGQIEGEVTLRKNNVTVGKGGRVKADIHGQTIHVEGHVKGNLYGDQEIVIRASGEVEGNIVSPRVTLENGSKFRGNIDMEPKTPPASGKLAQEKPASPAPGRGSGGGAPDKSGDAQPQLKPSVSGG
jgi:cytoskeletal protein CcmA (bactofilin family)